MTEVAAQPEAGPSTLAAGPPPSATPLADLLKLSSKRTRAVFIAENGEDDAGGLDRA